VKETSTGRNSKKRPQTRGPDNRLRKGEISKSGNFVEGGKRKHGGGGSLKGAQAGGVSQGKISPKVSQKFQALNPGTKKKKDWGRKTIHLLGKRGGKRRMGRVGEEEKSRAERGKKNRFYFD